MEITSEDLKKPQSWAIITPVILLLVALFFWYGMSKAENAANRELILAKRAVTAANEIIEIKRTSNIDLTGGLGKREFETVSSFIECAKAAGIPPVSMKKLSGEQPKTLRDGRKEYQEGIDLSNIRIEQLGKFIDFAESNFISLNCTDITITPSPNKSSEDRWNATAQFKHIK